MRLEWLLTCVGRVQVTEEWADGDGEGNAGYTVIDIDVPDESGLFKAMEVLSLAGVGSRICDQARTMP